MRKILLLIFYPIIFTSLSFVQAQSLRVEKIFKDDNFHRIGKTIQDEQGFVWIASSRRLHRYDGVNLKTYEYTPKDPSGIHGSIISDMYQDSKKRIWIQYFTGGVDLFEPALDKFTFFDEKAGLSSNSSVRQGGKNVLETKDGDIWIGTKNGLNRIDSLGNIKHYFAQDENSICDNRITALLEDSYGLLWIGTSKGLSIYNPKDKTFQSYYKSEQANAISSNEIAQLFEDSIGDIWVITAKNGACKISINKKNVPIDIEKYRFEAPFKDVINYIKEVDQTIYIGARSGLYAKKINAKAFEKIASFNTTKAVHDHKKRLWINSYEERGKIMAVRNMKIEQTVLLSSNAEDNILNDDIFSMHILKDQTLLVGMEWEGLVKLDLNQKPFYTQKSYPTNTQKQLTHIYSIHKEVDLLWIGAKSGLFSLDTKTGKYIHHITNESVSSITPTNKGFFWLGLFSSKMAKFYPKTGEVIYYNDDPESPYYFPGWSVRAINEDQSGTLWMTSFDHGVYALPKGATTFKNYTDSGKKGYALTSNKCYEMLIASDSTIYVGSILGLNQIHPKTGKITHFTSEVGNPKSLKANFIRALLEDSKGRIWVGTTEGLHLLNKEKGNFERYTTADGLVSNSVKSIAEDLSDDTFWIATDNGISNFNPDLGTFKNYNHNDGLCGNSCLNITYSPSDSCMYLGGTAGFTFFSPHQIYENENAAIPQFTSLKINGEVLQVGDTLNSGYILEKNINYTDQVVLNYNETQVEIGLASLNFSRTENNKLEYRIKEVDKYWRDASTHRTAYYSNLSDGTHTLQLRATNSDGVLNPEIRTLQIVVLVPWWKSIWFLSSLLILLFVCIYFYNYFKIRNMKRNEEYLRDEVEKKTKDLKEKNNELIKKQKEVLEQNEEIQSQSEELYESNERVELLLDFGYKVTASVDIKVVFLQISNTISTLIGADEVMLGHINAGMNLIEFWRGGQTATIPFKEVVPLDAKDRLSAYVIRTRRELLVGNIKETAETLLHDFGDYYQSQAHSGLYLPLQMKGRDTVGIIVAKSKKQNQFNQNDLELLKNLGHYITIAMENALAYEKITLQSKELMALNSKNDRFYTEVSHEFKTPLSLIISPVQELLKNSAHLSKQEYQILQLVDRNARRLERLVSQILDLKKAETGNTKLNLSKYDFAEQVGAIVESFQWVSREKDISLAFQEDTPPREGYFDIDKIEKVIFNLINNSIKYTPNGGHIDVCINYQQSTLNEQLIFTVKDNGIGISSHDIDKVFERYYRSERVDIGSQGTGIGLSLVKSFVELHQGTVTVESISKNDNPTQSGTLFTVILPMDLNHSVETVAEIEISSIQQPIQTYQNELKQVELNQTNHQLPSSKDLQSILIIEDNPELREYLKACLMSDWKIFVANDGIEGVKKAQEIIPDLILSDVMMPKADGFYVCETLSQQTATSHIPIILLTAKGDKEAIEKGFQLGAMDYILKPFDLDIIRKKIKNILDKRDHLKGQYKDATHLPDIEGASDDPQFLKQVVEILEKHVSDPQFGVMILANELGMSRTVLYERLKLITGKSINEFIKHYRMTLAIKLLSEKRLNVTEVSSLVGFSDAKYFSKCFKRKYGETPKNFSLKKQKEQQKPIVEAV